MVGDRDDQGSRPIRSKRREHFSDERVRRPLAGQGRRVAGAAIMSERVLDRGLNVKTTMGNVINLSPPLVISREEMEAALGILDLALGAVELEFGYTPQAAASQPHRPGVHGSIQSCHDGRDSPVRISNQRRA